MAAAADVATFCRNLGKLWEECGRPTYKSLETRCNVSDSQISEILRAKVRRLPSWDVVSALVVACAEHAGRVGAAPSLTTDLEYWRTEHGRVETAPRAASGRRKEASVWTDLVDQHPAWQDVADADRFQPAALAVAEQLFGSHRRADRALAGDPWRDDTLVTRFTDQVGRLISLIRENEPLVFSPLEAALLSLAPLAHQARTAQTAASLVHLDPTDLTASGDDEREPYERYLSGQEERRLVARAAQRGLADRDSASDEIGWWLFHRWVESRPVRASVLEAVALDERPTRKVMVDVLDRLVRLLRVSAGDLGNPSRLGLVSKTSYLGGVVVRERLLGLLLAVGHALAVEPLTLSPVLVEHLGIPDPVDLTELGTTLAELSWEPVRIGLGLVAECHHEATFEALREHVARTDTVLGAVHALAEDDAHLQLLRHLPARASSDRVEPAVRNGKQVFTVPVTRFHLNETRIRELLMGQQLYGDSSLAIRELYQNALDACRYRQARQQHLARQGRSTDWVGEITFEQGVDTHGRHFLRCVDNGVGMGEQELRDVFSQAGVRFADRPEFLEEQAEWLERLYPNSRFGIGVLSYFMLADEIEVTTCRMDRHGGRPGPVWHARIVGPGHLFRIKPGEDERAEPGTTVTLYLRDGADAPSCVDVLERLLGIAEFATTADHDGLTATWDPFLFRPRKKVGGETHGIDAGGALVHAARAPEGQVVWCEKGGALLADGLYVRPVERVGALTTLGDSPDLEGAVVNLARHWTPRLTVDRTEALDDLSDHVEHLLTRAAKELVAAEPEFLSHEWVCDLARHSPDVADIIAHAAITAGARLPSEDGLLAVGATGFLPSDGDLRRPHEEFATSHDELPDRILLWRLLVTRPGRAGIEWSGPAPLLRALPSDDHLMGYVLALWFSRYSGGQLPVGAVVSTAVDLGRGAREVAQRLTHLGYQVGPVDRFPDRDNTRPVDALLLSRDGNGNPPWLDADRQAPRSHIVVCQRSARMSPGEIVKRLQTYSITVDTTPGVSRFAETDLLLVSRDLNGKGPWLGDDEAAQVHAVVAATRLGWPLRRVIERLEMLGYRVGPPDPVLDEPPEVLDAAWQLRVDLDVRPPGARVPLAWILEAAGRLDADPERIGRVLDHWEVPHAAVEPLPGRLGGQEIAALGKLRTYPPYEDTISYQMVLQLANSTSMHENDVIDLMNRIGVLTEPRGMSNGQSTDISTAFTWFLRDLPSSTWSPAETLENCVRVAYQGNIPLGDVLAWSEQRGAPRLETRLPPGIPSELDVRILRNRTAVDALLGTAPVPWHLPFTISGGPRGVSPWRYATRLEELGMHLDFPQVPDESASIDILRIFDNTSNWHAADTPVRIRQVIGHALARDLHVHEVARILESYGFEVEPVDEAIARLIAEVPTDRGEAPEAWRPTS